MYIQRLACLEELNAFMEQQIPQHWCTVDKWNCTLEIKTLYTAKEVVTSIAIKTSIKHYTSIRDSCIFHVI